MTQARSMSIVEASCCLTLGGRSRLVARAYSHAEV